MKKALKYILLACLLPVGFASCNDEDSIKPSEVTGLASETRAGEIVLRWNTPDDGSVAHIKVAYNDPRLDKDVVRLASVFADSIVIPDTRARYPEYEFTVQTVSATGDLSAAQTIKQKSEAAAVTTKTSIQEITLSADDLSTNAQEPSEGDISNLLDGDTGTFFHTAWSVSRPAPHWMQVNLKETLDDHYRFFYSPRNNGNNKPTDVDLMGSTDGENWTLIKNFTQEKDELPTTSTDVYTSEVLECPFPFSQIRFVVNKTNNNTVFWTMSEFKFYNVTVSVFNPETDE